MTFAAAHRTRKIDDVTALTARLRHATDHLWREPFDRAETDIHTAGKAGHTWCIVVIPFPFDPEMRARKQEVLSVAHSYGFALRPGGPSGPAADIIRFERGER